MRVSITAIVLCLLLIGCKHPAEEAAYSEASAVNRGKERAMLEQQIRGFEELKRTDAKLQQMVKPSTSREKTPQEVEMEKQRQEAMKNVDVELARAKARLAELER